MPHRPIPPIIRLNVHWLALHRLRAFPPHAHHPHTLVARDPMTGMPDLEAQDELFEGRHFDREIIVLCVRWYLRFKAQLPGPGGDDGRARLRRRRAERGVIAVARGGDDRVAHARSDVRRTRGRRRQRGAAASGVKSHPTSALTHMWTAPSSQGNSRQFDQIACVHMSACWCART